MKLIYIISQGHSGSTLLDCILGSHSGIQSSGELRFLNWQLDRTINTEPSVENQSICTCEKDFRDCSFWGKVINKLRSKTGVDIGKKPKDFDTAYFGQFSYRDRGGDYRNFVSKIKKYVFRIWVEQGWRFSTIMWLEPKVKEWLKNNWLLYEAMSETAGKSVIVDSSKHLLIALLLQQYKPDDVTILFVHRSLEGLASSSKRKAVKNNQNFLLDKVIQEKRIFEVRVKKYKENVKGIKFIDVDYEHFTQYPSSFLKQIVETMGLDEQFDYQDNEKFTFIPADQHLVAGNPMRYRGKQHVKYDERWKGELNAEELQRIKRSGSYD